jgi:hypothetical protein
MRLGMGVAEGLRAPGVRALGASGTSRTIQKEVILVERTVGMELRRSYIQHQQQQQGRQEVRALL